MKEDSLELHLESQDSIRQKVYRHLRNEILNGLIPPGSRMVESRLAGRIGTSRTPVREALHLLEGEGLLESIPRVGYRVKGLDWDEVEEIVGIREVNETLAIGWALKRITPEEIRALEDNLAQAEAAIRSGSPESAVDYDAEFHEILVRASGSVRLTELCQSLRRHMLRYRIGSLSRPEVGLEAVAGHRRILASLKAGDLEGAQAALREHLEISKQAIRRTKFESPPGQDRKGGGDA